MNTEIQKTRMGNRNAEYQQKYRQKRKQHVRLNLFLTSEASAAWRSLVEKYDSLGRYKEGSINKKEILEQLIINTNKGASSDIFDQLKNENKQLRKKLQQRKDTYEAEEEIIQTYEKYAQLTHKELLVEVKKLIFWYERKSMLNDSLMDELNSKG